ncbi:hypothetical protein [Mammaliicoccus vitulinus]|uniref:hypothetical protein n=1 Tax=Mammaliicoccus vitulinus TaxID=71237 RepID=UPI00248BD0FF|nr:hypothetical protein [Mammaliicoccus vitulinus]
MLNTIKLLDSMDLINDEDEYLQQELMDDSLWMLNDALSKFVKDYEKRYKTSIAAFAFVGERASHYGAIGGNGRICGVPCENKDIGEALEGCDGFEFNITEDKTFELRKIDHDGSNFMELRLVTQNEYNTYQIYLEDYFNLAEFIFNLGKKPTKMSNDFIQQFKNY